MPLRKGGLVLAILFVVLSVAANSSLAFTKRKPLTMIVVPAKHSVLQVAFDLAKRHQAILVSYQGDAQSTDPLLHAWNGHEWVFVSIPDYEAANFLQFPPERTVLVGDADDLPEMLIPASAWCPVVMSIPSLETATLLNSFAKVFDFSKREWNWFTARYDLKLVDMNEDQRKRSWYDQPHPEFKQSLKKTSPSSKAPSDAAAESRVFDEMDEEVFKRDDSRWPSSGIAGEGGREASSSWEPEPAELVTEDREALRNTTTDLKRAAELEEIESIVNGSVAAPAPKAAKQKRSSFTRPERITDQVAEEAAGQSSSVESKIESHTTSTKQRKKENRPAFEEALSETTEARTDKRPDFSSKRRVAPIVPASSYEAEDDFSPSAWEERAVAE